MNNLLVVFCIIVLGSSCVQYNNNNSNNTSKQNEPHRQAHISFNGNSYLTNIWDGHIQNDPDRNYSLGVNTERIKSRQILNILESNYNIILSEQPIALVLYCGKTPEMIRPDIVKGVLVYTRNKNKKLSSILFIQKNGSYVKDKHFPQLIKHIEYHDIYSVSNYVAGKSNNRFSYLTFSEDFSYISGSDNYITSILKKNNSVDLRAPCPEWQANNACKSPCPPPCSAETGDGNRCVASEKPGGIVFNKCYCVCAAKKVINMDTILNDITANFNINDLYFIRDSILSQSGFGTKYINYYYVLTESIYEDIDLNKAFKIIKLGNSILPKLEYFYSTSYQDSILIQEEDRINIIGLIQDFESETNDSLSLNILNNIRNDINDIAGKKTDFIKNNY